MAYVSYTEALDADEEAVVGQFNAGPADRIVGSVFADQPGTIYIEQSGDGENWDISTNYPVVANDGAGFSEEILLPFVRVRYANGSEAQSTFRIVGRTASSGPR